MAWRRAEPFGVDDDYHPVTEGFVLISREYRSVENRGRSGRCKRLLAEFSVDGKSLPIVCGYCNAPLNVTGMTIDHIIPRSRGGSGELGNLVLACRLCNMRKSSSIQPVLYGPKAGCRGLKKTEALKYQ